MRFIGLLLPVLVLFAVSFAPLDAVAADTALGRIFPEGCDCPGRAPDWGCVLQTIQNLINAAIAFGVVIATLIIAYAGALLLFSPFHAANRQLARNILLNALIGLAVALSGWLIVDFIMKNLYNASGASDGVELGPWNEILAGGAECVDVNQQAGNITAPNVGNIGNPGGGGLDSVGPQECPETSNGLCFQSGRSSQYAHASAPLIQLMQCIKGKVPAGVGQISSISHSSLVGAGDERWNQCRASVVCEHSVNSCHFGGRNCRKGQPNPFVSGSNFTVNQSYAVDYGDGGADSVAISEELEAAAEECGGAINREGNHLHVSIRGPQCGCDAGL